MNHLKLVDICGNLEQGEELFMKKKPNPKVSQADYELRIIVWTPNGDVLRQAYIELTSKQADLVRSRKDWITLISRLRKLAYGAP